MNKDMFRGIIGLLALGVYGGKFILGVIYYANGDFQTAALVLIAGMIFEFFAFLYVMGD